MPRKPWPLTTTRTPRCKSTCEASACMHAKLSHLEISGTGEDKMSAKQKRTRCRLVLHQCQRSGHAHRLRKHSHLPSLQCEPKQRKEDNKEARWCTCSSSGYCPGVTSESSETSAENTFVAAGCISAASMNMPRLASADDMANVTSCPACVQGRQRPMDCACRHTWR